MYMSLETDGLSHECKPTDLNAVKGHCSTSAASIASLDVEEAAFGSASE